MAFLTRAQWSLSNKMTMLSAESHIKYFLFLSKQFFLFFFMLKQVNLLFKLIIYLYTPWYLLMVMVLVDILCFGADKQNLHSDCDIMKKPCLKFVLIFMRINSFACNIIHNFVHKSVFYYRFDTVFLNLICFAIFRLVQSIWL